MLKITNYKTVKRYLFLFCLLVSQCAGYGQLNVQSGLVQQTNQYSAHLCDGCPNQDIAQDLFFSIGPNGIPQYGRDVSWNLAPNSSGIARYFHIKKGDWDRSAIRTAQEVVDFNSDIQNYPTSANRNSNMGNDWIKIGKSWNFSHDNYAIAIISFTNQSQNVIDKGTIVFSHDILPFLRMDEIIMYNDWVELSSNVTDLAAGKEKYTFDYAELAPSEIRYLYVKMDISKESSYKIPDTNLEVEMTGFGTASIGIGGTFPPHDPNSLTLLTAFENTSSTEDCSAYSSDSKIEEACLKGLPFWTYCTSPGDLKCPLLSSLNYPYCNEDSEELTYRIDCLNEGHGVAKHIEIENLFSSLESPFDPNIFTFSGSQEVNGGQHYPSYDFNFEEINLPGLKDEAHFYTYDECSAYVVFTVKTLCYINVDLSAVASIVFIGSNNAPEDPIFTNSVRIVPEQGVYNNYTPSCETCYGYGPENRFEKYVPNDFKLISTNYHLDLTFSREAKENPISVKIFDVNGITNHNIKLAPNGSNYVSETIDISNLASGIYFLSIQDGSENYIEKFIHY